MKPWPGRVALRRVAALAGAPVALLLMGELLVRGVLLFPGSASLERRLALFADDPVRSLQPRYEAHPYTAYALTQGYADAQGGTHHNAHGFRGPELDSIVGPSHVRIVALGGSTTYTIKVADDRDTYPQQLQRILRDGTSRTDVEVVNAGVGGFTTFETLVSFAFRILPLEPDIIVVYHATNDLHARRVERYLPDNTGYRRSWKLESSAATRLLKWSYLLRLVAVTTTPLQPLGVEHYTRRNDELNDHPSVGLLQVNPPTNFARNLRSLVQLARANGIQVVLCTFASNPNFRTHYAAWEYYLEGFEEMNRVITEVAAEQGVLLADVDRAMPRDTTLWADGVHVTAAGARERARIVADVMLDAGLLGSTAAGSSAAPSATRE